MSEHYYKSNFTLEDFRQLVEDLENDRQREHRRRRNNPDQSWEQMLLIAKQDGGSLYKLDNGMFVTPLWCREYLEALDAWEKREIDLILNRSK